MKYRCLILDHDDTVVDSTRKVHYPCFVEYMKAKRPEYSITFEEYLEKNSHPGFIEFFTEELGFSRKELKEEEIFWNEYVQKHVPKAYEGWAELLTNFQKKGGIVCVISHSLSHNIYRDYRENGLPKPDAVYGWERPEDERKPSPYAIFEIEKQWNVLPKKILVVDDLKPGLDMARKCGVDFAAAGWAYNLPQIQEYLKKNSKYYLENVGDLEKVLLED